MEEIMNHEPVPEELAQEQTPPVVSTEKTKKRPLWILWVCIGLLVAAAVAFFLTANLRKYARAESLLEAGDHAGAAAVFAELGDYKDAAEKSQAVLYDYAESVMEEGNYAEAVQLYEQLGDYEKSQRRVLQCYYMLAKAAIKAEQRDTAIEYLELAGDYTDAAELRLQTIYAEGHALFMAGRYDDAQAYFDRLLKEGPEYYIPHFVEAPEAIDYMKAITEPIESVSVVVRSIAPYYKDMDYWNSAVQQSLGYQFGDVIFDEEEQSITLKPDYYPGQKIVWARESGDFSKLSDEERQTYEAAVALVEQAKEETEDMMELELWLHDWICTHVEYDSPYTYVYPEDYVGLDELTCVGAILNGKANCQGYTDAFYLLGTLAGLEVHKVFGMAGEGHCWNAVRLDGWLYTVDVTFNDTSCPEPEERTYIWYNNALDMNQYTVFGGVSQFEQMVFLQDTSKTYYAMNDLIFDDLDDAALKLLKRHRKNGRGMDYAIVKETGLDSDDFYDAVSDQMGAAGVYSARWWVIMETYKEQTYITVHWE